MSNFFEHEGDAGFEFIPFDDARESNRYLTVATIEQSGSGMDTTGFDVWRQGVELTMPKYLYGGMVAKIWAGNLNHYTKIITYGQARSWTEYTELKYHDDELVPFNPTNWITDPENFHTPLYFNEGPQQEEEAIIEPFTFPFRKDPLVGVLPPRSIKAYLEDGNNFLGEAGNNKISQFIDYDQPLDSRFFLDSGEEYIGPIKAPGEVATVALPQKAGKTIMIEGHIPLIVRNNQPFNDTNDEEIVKQLTITTVSNNDSTFLSELKKLNIELDDEIRGEYNLRSASAGHFVYGPNMNRVNTDSVSYVGMIRGS